MIQVPVIFSVFPREVPATLFGTNKIASVVGTSNAAFRYIRSVKMPWGATLPAAVAAFVFVVCPPRLCNERRGDGQNH